MKLQKNSTQSTPKWHEISQNSSKHHQKGWVFLSKKTDKAQKTKQNVTKCNEINLNCNKCYKNGTKYH